jgi:hypothetical protein
VLQRGRLAQGLEFDALILGAPAAEEGIVGGAQVGGREAEVAQGEALEVAQLAVLREETRSAGLGEGRHDGSVMDRGSSQHWAWGEVGVVVVR